MSRSIATALAAAFLIAAASGGAFAAGDATKGEKVFKKCKTCHTVEADKKKAQGPNLLGVVGRTAGTADYKYSDAMIEAGEKGLVWDEDNMNEYVRDPKKFLAKFLDAKRVKNKMKFKLKNDTQRADVIAYLKSLSN